MSTASVVKQTMVMLSDAVTQMMLIVVPLQEENAPMGPDLGRRTEVVAKISNNLAQIATNLARDGYEAFPDIMQTMLAAADEVRGSVSGLSEALGELKGTENRKKGWQILVNSCAAISTKTVLLLKIVYGVEVKRILAASKVAMSKVNQVDPDTLATDPKLFVKEMGEAATELSQLSEYIATKVDDPDLTPEMQEQLRKAAERQQASSDDLVQAANELLRDKENPEKKRALLDALEEARDAINAANVPMTSLKEMVDNLEGNKTYEKKSYDAYGEGVEFDREALAKKMARANAILQQLKDPNLSEEEKKELLRELEDLEREIQREAALGAQAYEKCGDPKKAQALAKLVEGYAREMELLKKGIREGTDINGSLDRLLGMLDRLNDLAGGISEEEIQADLIKNDLAKMEECVEQNNPAPASQCARRVLQGKSALEKCEPAGEFGDKQRANVKELGDDVVADIKSLRDALNAADDPEKKEEFKRANAVALADTAKVGAYAKPHYANDLENLVDELQGEIWDLSSAKEDGDKVAMEEAIKALQGTREKLVPVARRSIEQGTDPVKRKEEALSLDKLLNALDDLVKAAEDGSRSQVKPERDRALELSDELVATSCSDALADADHLRRSVADFVAASVKDDREGVSKSGKEMVSAETALAPTAKRAAVQTGNPQVVQRVNNDLDKLDELIAEFIGLSEKLIDANDAYDQPEANRVARELLECEEEANRALDDLCSAIKPGCGGPHPQTPSALESDIPPHLRPRYDAAKELESIMPALIDAAKRAKENPGDEEKAKFIKLLESTQSPLKQISPTDTPEDRALALAKLLDDHVEQMARGARDGKQDTVLCGAREGSDVKNQLVPLAREIADSRDPLERQRIHDAADRVDKLFPKTVSASKRLLDDPQNPQRQDELEKILREFEDALDALHASIERSPEEKALAARTELKKAMRGALHKVDLGNKKGALGDARKAQRVDLTPFNLLAEGKRNENDMLGALDRLNSLLKDLEDATTNAADAPPGSQPRKDLEKCVCDAEDLLDQLVDASGAETIAAIERETRELGALRDGLDNDDPVPVLRDGIKEVVKDHRELLPLLKEHQARLQREDPKRAEELENPIKRMEAMMPGQIQKTKAVIVEPDNYTARRELEEACAALEVPLSQAAAIVQPSTLNDLKKKLKEKDLEAQSVAAGRMVGDEERVKDNVAKLKELEELKDLINKRNEEMAKSNPAGVVAMSKGLRELEDAIRDVERSAKDPSKVGDSADQVSRVLKDLEFAAEGNTPPSDVALANATVDDLLQILKGPLSSSNRLDMNDLLKMAKDLSDEMNGMIDGVSKDAKRQGESGREAVSVVDRMKALDKRASMARLPVPKKEEEKKEPLQVKPAVKRKPRAKPVAPAPNAPFHEKMEHMAQAIDVAGDITGEEKLLAATQGISAALMELATAAKEGNRTELIKRSALVASEIDKLVISLREIALTITDKRMQDRMNWLASMVKDLGTNLKILCSVKAAHETPDNDDQIISVVTSLKNIISESVDLTNIATKTKKRKL